MIFFLQVVVLKITTRSAGKKQEKVFDDPPLGLLLVVPAGNPGLIGLGEERDLGLEEELAQRPAQSRRLGIDVFSRELETTD